MLFPRVFSYGKPLRVTFLLCAVNLAMGEPACYCDGDV
jgi:hypothetical protein